MTIIILWLYVFISDEEIEMEALRSMSLADALASTIKKHNSKHVIRDESMKVKPQESAPVTIVLIHTRMKKSLN